MQGGEQQDHCGADERGPGHAVGVRGQRHQQQRTGRDQHTAASTQRRSSARPRPGPRPRSPRLSRATAATRQASGGAGGGLEGSGGSGDDPNP
ncbi:hypothetical protein GQF42_05095 [Streptomyces broussonetiae]|uniref:Uncharacterized protein n=1 Tax=Streptomyces broussonetiae TaxID=2686304 RepID=A0A6I6MTF4_9ACTN|nr:hypothetical protein [Streptomyces broussonetiae]QHA02742.1 hypothetical protein GQF42_05095 [Streptomyces broussonetiae]